MRIMGKMTKMISGENKSHGWSTKQKLGNVNSSPCYVPNVLFHQEAVNSPLWDGFLTYSMRGLG